MWICGIRMSLRACHGFMGAAKPQGARVKGQGLRSISAGRSIGFAVLGHPKTNGVGGRITWRQTCFALGNVRGRGLSVSFPS